MRNFIRKLVRKTRRDAPEEKIVSDCYNSVNKQNKVADIFSSNPPTGTHYQDEYDLDRINAIRPYKVSDSGMSLEQVYSNVNVNFYAAYGPDFSDKTTSHISVDPPLEYQRILESLVEIEGLNVDTFSHYHPKRTLKNDELACVVRHDVDGDLVAALQQAEIEHKLGCKTSYYILHTAPYYGAFSESGELSRNNASADAYRVIQNLGHEIALHTDGYHIYQQLMRDGSQAVKQEIDWLRENGCNLDGTTAHNSASIYGCENFAIFKDKTAGKYKDKKGVFHNGKWSPLQVLDESELGINYEANELIWQSETPVFYCALRSQNLWRIDFLNFNQKILEQEHAFGTFKQRKNTFVSTDDVLDVLRVLTPPCYIYMVVHPMHYGLRNSDKEKPWLATEPTDTTSGNIRTWAGGGKDQQLRGSSVTVLNELNTPDRGLDNYKSGAYKVAFFGHENMSTHTINADSKFSQVAAQYLTRSKLAPRTSAIGFGASDHNIDHCQRMYQVVCDASLPDALILTLPLGQSYIKNYIAWAKYILESGVKLVSLIEEPFDPDNLEHKLTLDLIEAELDSPLIIASYIFDAYHDRASLYWYDSQIWAPQAHALIGRSIAQCIESELNDLQ